MDAPTPATVETPDQLTNRSDRLSDTWSHTAAFALLTGGITMMFLATSTITTDMRWSYPALLTPGVVAIVLAAQRRVGIGEILGDLRPDAVALALAAGPFTIVLSMVLTSTPRLPGVAPGPPAWWAFVAAAVAAFGWWAYLYPVVRSTLAPAPASAIVALAWYGWHGLLGWADANPFTGTGPFTLLAYAVGVGFLLAATCEHRPRSAIPAMAFAAGSSVAIAHLRFAPAEVGSSGHVVMASITSLLAGAVIMVLSKIGAVRHARHASRSH